MTKTQGNHKEKEIKKNFTKQIEPGNLNTTYNIKSRPNGHPIQQFLLLLNLPAKK
jgi:hypothetical protein